MPIATDIQGDAFGYPAIAMHAPVAPFTKSVSLAIPASKGESSRVPTTFYKPTLLIAMEAYVRPQAFADAAFPREPTTNDVKAVVDLDDQLSFTEQTSSADPNGSAGRSVVLASLSSRARLWFARLQPERPQLGIQVRWAYDDLPPADLVVDVVLFTMPLAQWDRMVEQFGAAAKIALATAVRNGGR